MGLAIEVGLFSKPLYLCLDELACFAHAILLSYATASNTHPPPPPRLTPNPKAPKEAGVCQSNKKALDSLAIIFKRQVMPDSVVVSGRVDNTAQSFHLKHTLTARISDHGYTHIPALQSVFDTLQYPSRA